MPNYPWLDEYVLSKRGASIEWQEDWQADKFVVGGKMFGLRGGDKWDKPIVTLKLAPAHGAVLRAAYPDIAPGHYMNKTHWNSVRLEGEVSDELLRAMIDESYGLVFAALPKKLREEIENESD